MVAVSIPTFGGMVPALDDRKLPDTSATISQNTWLYSGALQGIRKPRLLRSVPLGTARSFRIPQNYNTSPEIYADSLWLDFSNPQTDVIRAPVFNDTFDRYYWAASAGEPRYNTYDRIENGDPSWVLGVTTPNTAPGLVVTGGSGTTVSRAYVYTYVSEYGEEGAPSPPVLVNGFIDGSWDVTWDAPSPTDQGVNRTLTKVRVYRTITSSGGIATFFRVGEFPVAVTSYSDVQTDTEVSGNPQLESFSWTPPPSDLQGFTVMPNGIIAGWRNNELWFSEPYRPHAWPAAYVLTMAYPIIGLGISNQTLVVCTSGFPITASGVNPAYISTSILTTFEPCTSRESIMSAPEGVYYASPNGLVLVQPGQAMNITKDLVTVDKWADLTPHSFRAARYGVSYYAFGALTGEVFNADAFNTDAFVNIDYTDTQRGVLIDTSNARIGFNFLTQEAPVVGVMNDSWSGELMLIFNDSLYWIDSREQDPEVIPFKWRSKVFHTPKKLNFGAMKIYFTVPNGTPAQNPVADNTLNQTLSADQYGLMRLFANGEHVLTRELRNSGELMRLMSGFKAEFWQIELEGRVNITACHMAGSPKELQRV